MAKAAPAPIGPLRRIITGDNPQNLSLIMLDGPAANADANPERSGLYEIWTEDLARALDAKDFIDHADGSLRLSPELERLKVRWFVVEPLPAEIPKQKLQEIARRQFKALGAEHELADQTKHPFMHKTASLDVVVLIKGSASLVLDQQQTRLQPGDVVIQRATAHAWIAHDEPALFMAVLIGRKLQRT